MTASSYKLIHIDDLIVEFDRAPIGEDVVYFVGNLQRTMGVMPKFHPERKAIDMVKSWAWDCAQVGDGALMQRKIGDEIYQYLIKKKANR